MSLIKYIACVLFISSCFNSQAQTEDQFINWGETVRSDGTHEIIGKSGGSLFVSSVSSGGLFSKNPDLYLLRFDESNEFKGDFNLKNIIGNKNRMIDIIANDYGVALLALNREDKNNFHLEKIFIDPQSMKILKRQALVKLESQFSFPSLRSSSSDPSNFLTQQLSQDKRKVALIFSRKLKDYINTQIIIYDRANAFTKLNEFEIELLDDKKESENILDLTINDDGSMSILLKHYFNNNQVEKNGGKPDYELLVIHVPTEGDIQERKIRMKSRFISHAKIKQDKDGNVVVAGLYEKKQGKGAEGIAIFKIDKNNQLAVSKYIKSQAIPRDKERLDNNFELTDFFEMDDSYVMVSREKEISNFINNNNNFYNDRYYNRYGARFNNQANRILEFKNLRTIIEAVDTAGVHRWVSVLTDNALQENSSEFIENGYVMNNDELIILNNMHQNNFERLGEEKMKRRTYPNNRNIILKTLIDQNGNVSAKQLSYPTHFHIIPTEVLRIGDKIYFCGLSSRRSDIMVGSIPVN